MAIDVRQAVRLAKDHVAHVFADESIENLGLEEVRYDDHTDQWRVTVGFLRSWDRALNVPANLFPHKRPYRVVVVRGDGVVEPSVEIRELAA